MAKAGDHKITLQGVNTYTGETTISAGVLALGGSGSIATSSGLKIADGASFDISGVTSDTTIKNVDTTGDGTGVIIVLGDKKLTIGENTVGNGGGTYKGVFTGTGVSSLVKTGTETLSLYGSSGAGFEGDTAVNEGTVKLYALDALGTGTVTIATGAVLSLETAGTLANNLAGAGRLSHDSVDVGEVALSGDSTGFAGAISVTNANTLAISAAENVGTASFTLNAGTLRATGTLTLAANTFTLGGAANNTSGTFSVNDGAVLTLGGVISGKNLHKTGLGTLALSGTNLYTGTSSVDVGTLALIGAGSIAESAGVILAQETTFDISGLTTGSPATIKTLNGGGADAKVALGNNELIIAPGAGAVNAGSFAGVFVGGENSALQLNGSTANNTTTLDLTNRAALEAFGGTVNIANGTIKIYGGDTTQFNSPLVGTGVLFVTLDNASSQFSFTDRVDDGFEGIVELSRGKISLDNDGYNVTSLTNATLKLDTEATAEIKSRQLISFKGLTLNGGTLDFTAAPITPVDFAPLVAPGVALKVEKLDITGGGKLVINKFSETIATNPPAEQNIFDYWQSPENYQVLLVEADNVAGTGPITWDPAPFALPNSAAVSRLIDGGNGTAIFNYAGAVDANGTRTTAGKKGIYLGYGLSEILAIGGATVTLDAYGAKAGARITARLGELAPGGGFKFTGVEGQEILIGNVDNSYTGATTIDKVSVKQATDDAFGYTNKLNLTVGAKLDQNGLSQSVGSLYGEDGVELVLGKLEVKNGGAFAGVISGADTDSELALTGGTLDLSGANTYAGKTLVTNGELLITGTLGENANYSGDIAIETAGKITFNQDEGVTQTLSGTLAAFVNTSIVKRGESVLVFAGDNGGNNADVSVFDGTLSLGSDNTEEGATNNLGSGQGTYTLDGGRLLLTGTSYVSDWVIGVNDSAITHENEAKFAGDLSGTGALELTGSGVLTLAGDNTGHSGALLVTDSALAIGSDANVGTGTLTLDGAELVLTGTSYEKDWVIGDAGGKLSASGDTVFSGDVSGTGALALDVAGHLIFEGEIAGPNTAAKTGTGTLEVNGHIASPFSLEVGTLAGTGFIDDASFSSGTTIAPGTQNTTGTLTIGSPSTTTYFADITLQIDLESADRGAPVDNADHIAILGDAVFGSGIRIDLSANNPGSGWTDGAFSILSTEGILDASPEILAQTVFSYKGITVDVPNSRLKAALVNENGKALVLKTYASASLQIIWDGSASTNTWDKNSTKNWREGTVSGRDFQDGDIVTFANGEGVEKVISVTPSGGGVLVGRMTVTGNDFIFDGGRIAGVSTRTNGPVLGPDGVWGEIEADASLLVATGASVTFLNDVDFAQVNVAGSARFAGHVASAQPISVANGGTFTLADEGTLGTDNALNIANDGKVAFDRSQGSPFTYNGTISGTGELLKTGEGKLTLTNENTYTGNTTVTGGALSIGSDTNIGGGINTLNGGALNLTGGRYAKDWTIGANGGTIDNAAGVAFDGVLSGAGNFAKTGLGKLSLSGANTYTGDTTVEGGVLEFTGSLGQQTDASTHTHSGNFALASGDLAFNHQSGTQTLTGTLSGTGNFSKNGAGELVFEGAGKNHTAGSFNNISGVTRIQGALTARSVENAGELHFRSITGDVTNRAGATLFLDASGDRVKTINGTLRNDGWVRFENYGNILYVNNLDNASSTGTGYYDIEVDLANPSNTDRLVFANGGVVKGRHVFLIRDYTFDDTVTTETVVPLIENAVFDADAEIVITGEPIITGILQFGIVGSGNATLRTTGYSPVGQALVNTSASTATGWFTQLDNFVKRMGDLRLTSVSAARQADAAKDTPALASSLWTSTISSASNAFWVRGYGQQMDTDLGIEGVSDFRENQYGADIGIDHAFILNDRSALYLGVHTGYQVSRRSFHDAFGSKGTGESIAGGTYASWLHKNGWYVDGTLKAQYFETEYDAGTDHGEFENYGIGFSLESGKRFDFDGSWFVEPSAQFAYTHIVAESYSTTNGLRVTAGDSDIYRYTAAVRAGKTFDLGERGLIQPFLRAGIEHQESDGGSIRVGGTRLIPNTDGTRLLLGVGTSWQLTPNQQIHLEYEASFGDKYDKPWGINASYRIRF
ncbi:MAG: autotransporter outer membrane beta-barrel domain-containing protein [Puniceicoccales bacterium]|nr:autotransporter outer membrane beta-barrel domain-containing protein [Puniceicoccales bacterium]